MKKYSYHPYWEYEPNNLYHQALPVDVNQSYKGYISPKKDKDILVLTLQEDKNLKIEISPVPQLDFLILLYDSEKKEIKQINNRPEGEGEEEILSLKAGTYYVILKDADNQSNFYENYILPIKGSEEKILDI